MIINSVLVANRGEIARRVFATCRRRGLATVAVFADADAGSPHVREADSAVRLPGTTPAETYLRGDLIIAAAHRAGADAIHPGYGFLAENAGFARAVEDAGLTWIGPTPEAIEVMGSKIESKRRMAAAGLPVLDLLDPATVTEAELPVLVKASAGGGGRGMRIVRTLAELPEAVASAAREAATAFGDATVFCERYLDAGHHVEVQILADTHGTVWALGERECSLQRRHQKVIEEAPAPLVDRLGEDLRKRLLAAGREAAATVGYRGAGTVEFLADERGDFWFLEMNTRLQVEHPVTECVTGTDLVGLQIDIAAGRPLSGPEPAMTGHAIEARLYAESPADDWRPETGTVVTFDVPDVTARFGRAGLDGIRLDSGVENGSVIGTRFDGMLAKVIAYASTREAAARQLAAALRRTRVHGVTTNRELLIASLLHPEFLAGTAATDFYTAHPPAALTAAAGLNPELGALVAALSDAAMGLDPDAGAQAASRSRVATGLEPHAGALAATARPRATTGLDPDGGAQAAGQSGTGLEPHADTQTPTRSSTGLEPHADTQASTRPGTGPEPHADTQAVGRPNTGLEPHPDTQAMGRPNTGLEPHPDTQAAGRPNTGLEPHPDTQAMGRSGAGVDPYAGALAAAVRARAATGLDPEVGALVAGRSGAAQVVRLARGFRNIPVGYRSRTYAVGDREIEVRYRFGRAGLEVAGMDTVVLVDATAEAVVLDLDGVRRRWTVGRFDDRVVVEGPRGSAELRRVPRFTDPAAQLPAGALVAPIPGTVVRVDVRIGEHVVAGQALIWLEAMKMEHVVRAPADGTVTGLPVPVGQQVSQGTPLAVVSPPAAGPGDG